MGSRDEPTATATTTTAAGDSTTTAAGDSTATTTAAGDSTATTTAAGDATGTTSGGGSASSTTATTTATEQAVTPLKLKEFAKKLRGSEEAAAELEAKVAEAYGKIKESEKAFTDAFNRTATAQDDIWTLGKHAAKNRQILTSISTGAAKLAVEVEGLQSDSTQVDKDAKDGQGAVKTVADRAEQLLGLGHIRGRTDGCLDAPKPKVNGEKVQMWTCGKAQDSQLWVYNTATAAIKHQKGECLAANPANGEVMMWACDATVTSQQWKYDLDKGLITNVATSTCLTADDQSVKGSTIKMQACSDKDPGQLWALIPGGANIRQQLEKVNTLLWSMEDATSENSLDKQEREVAILQRDTALFEATLASKSRKILLKRLRHNANRVRRAVKRLGEAASLANPIFDAETAPARGRRARIWGALREDVLGMDSV